MKIKSAIVVIAVSLLSATPASAFSWQQFWTGHSTPEDSPLHQACQPAKVGFLAAAPCMSRRLRLTATTASQVALADAIDALAAQVKRGEISDRQAYAQFEGDRELVNRTNRARQDAARLQDFSNGLQRQLEINNTVQCLRGGWC